MEPSKLGRLARVEVRDIWEKEAGDFTPWLAREENLSELAETLGLDLELQSVERGVGHFRADIVCKDTVDGSFVLIENQLERTDHGHLGQLLTYAAGVDVVTIVWIAERFTDEHRAALDWLNLVTNDRISFFGLEIEVWRIGDSLAAPKFNVVSRPNDWTKQTAATVSDGELTETKQAQLEYWTRFREFLQSGRSQWRCREPRAQQWTDFPTGRSGLWYSANIDTRGLKITVQLNLGSPEAKSHFQRLLEQRTDIERDVGLTLQWDENPGKKSSQVRFRREGDPMDRARWAEQHAWIEEHLTKFNRAFRQRIQSLPRNGEDDVPEQSEQ